MSIAKTQTSESFRLSALLSFSGGLQDAYTYNVRDGVFANAQTGNVVLMSQNYMQGEWHKGLRYMLPLISFAAGIFLAERIESRFKTGSKIHWRQIILFIEIVMLLAVGFMPSGLSMLANIMVSFSCAMQVQTFRKVHGCFLQAPFGKSCKVKMDNLACPKRTKLQGSPAHTRCRYKSIANVLLISDIGDRGFIFSLDQPSHTF